MRRYIKQLLPFMVLLMVPAMCGNKETECKKVFEILDDAEAQLKKTNFEDKASRETFPKTLKATETRLRKVKLTDPVLKTHVKPMAKGLGQSSVWATEMMGVITKLQTAQGKVEKEAALVDPALAKMSESCKTVKDQLQCSAALEKITKLPGNIMQSQEAYTKALADVRKTKLTDKNAQAAFNEVIAVFEGFAKHVAALNKLGLELKKVGQSAQAADQTISTHKAALEKACGR